MSTILVTGGKGFLGSYLVSRLAEQRETVRVFARCHTKVTLKQTNGYDVSWGDIRDTRAVDQAVKGVDAVIHLVSNFRKGGSDKKEAYAVNVEGTENVLRASVKHGVKRFIHCSTIGVHGDVRQVPADEDTPFNPGDLYQETKLIAEKRVWECYRKTGLPTTVIRPISMFGPGDRRMLKLFRMIKKRRFVMIGDGKALFQPAYIDDVVNGFLLCLKHEGAIGQALIVGGEEYVSLTQLMELIAAELGVPTPTWSIPLAPVRWLAGVCEGVCAPLGVEPPLHKRRISFFQNSRAFRIDKAKRTIGYEPRVSLREGIRRTIDWYETHGWL